MAGSALFYNEGSLRIGGADFDYLSETIELWLLMTNTTCDTEDDGIALDTDFTTLDEHDGANYARKTLGGKTLTKEDASNRTVAKATDVTFTALGAGARDVDGFMLVWIDGANKRPFSYHKYETARIADGADFEVKFRTDTGIWVFQT